MRGETENRAEKYIRNHKNRKKWLAFVLCLSLFTGTATLYGLNKPATAMTEEGAGQVGLVMETADNEFEQGLIEQMESEEEETSDSSENIEEGQDSDTEDENVLIEEKTGDEKEGENLEEDQESETVESAEEYASTENSDKASTSDSSDNESGVSSSASSSSTLEESAGDASSAASSGASAAGEASSEASTKTVEESNVEEVKDVEITVVYNDLNGEEIAESKQLSIEDSFDITSEVRELEGYIFNKAFINEQNVIRIEKKIGEIEISSEKEENTDSVASYISEDDENTRTAEYIYYEATTVDGKTIVIKEDTELILQYFVQNMNDEFVFSDGAVTVTVKLSNPGVLPEGVELDVKTVDASTEGYNYAVYMEALNEKASDISEAINKGNSDVNPSLSEVSQDAATYDETNTILFDVAFMLNDVEYEPKDGGVSVSVEFNDKQISEGLDAADESNLAVIHLPLSEEIVETVNSTSEATEIKSEDVNIDVLSDSSIEFTDEADVLNFELDTFSIIAIYNQNGYKYSWTGDESYSAKDLVEMLGDTTYFGAVTKYYGGTGGDSESNIATINYADGAAQTHTVGNSTKVYEHITDYSITVTKKVVGSDKADKTFYFGLFTDEDATNKISEFTITTGSDGEGSVSLTDSFDKYKHVYVYELDGLGGKALLDSESFDSYTVTYDADTVEGGSEAVGTFSSSFVENLPSISGMSAGSVADYLCSTVNGTSLYYKESDSVYYEFVRGGSGNPIRHEGDFPVNIENMLSQACEASTNIARAKDSDNVTVINVVGTDSGYRSDLSKYYFKKLYDESYAVNTGFTVDSDELLVINLDLTGRDSYTINQIKVNGYLTGQNWDDIANQVIINPVQLENGEYVPYTGTVNVDLGSGTLVAPAARVNLNTGAYVGTVIADTLYRGIEIHKITVRRFLTTQGSVSVTNTSANNILNFQLYKFINGNNPGNATFSFTVRRLKDDMSGWMDSTSGATSIKNSDSSIKYEFNPSVWSMVAGNTYYFKITEDELEADSAYTIDKSIVFVKVYYKGADDAEITYYKLDQDEETWIQALEDNSNNTAFLSAFVPSFCSDEDRVVSGDRVCFDNTTVEGKIEIPLFKYLNGEEPGSGDVFSFTVKVLLSDGTLETLTDSLENDGKNITIKLDIKNKYINSEKLRLIVSENKCNSDNITTDTDYIVVRVNNPGTSMQKILYYKVPADNIFISRLSDESTNNATYVKSLTEGDTSRGFAISAEEAAFYNTSTGNLRIHKMVVNDFGKDDVRNAANSILNSVTFKITNNTTGKYILFKASVKNAVTAVEYEKVDGTPQETGNTYEVAYNRSAQWTVIGIPGGTYTVEEVGDGRTFEYSVENDSSYAIDYEGFKLSRITKYEVTDDSEDPSAINSFGIGGENYRKVYSIDLGDDSHHHDDAPDDVLVGSTEIDNTSHTQTVQVCNYYSIPIGPIEFTKNFVNGDWTSDMSFTFKIEAAGYYYYNLNGGVDKGDVSTQPLPDETEVTVTGPDLDGNGNSTNSRIVSFGGVPFKYAGTYYYKITEVTGEDSEIDYDDTVFYLKIDVVKDYTQFTKTYTIGEMTHPENYSGDKNDKVTVWEDFYYLRADVTYALDESFCQEDILAKCSLYLGLNPFTGVEYKNEFYSIWTIGSVSDVAFNNSKLGCLTVTKSWLTSDGEDNSSENSSLNLDIWQRVEGSDVWTVYKTITLTTDKWTQTVTGLPLKDTEGKKYEYCVKEPEEYLRNNYVTYQYGNSGSIDAANQEKVAVVGLNGEEVSLKDVGYVMTVEDGANDYGTVYITNKTIFRNALPSTGGAGKVPFATFGIILITIATCGLYLSNRRKENANKGF